MALQVIILAAGQGKRMHSRLPKVLHTLAGKPLLEYVILNAETLSSDRKPIVIFGHQGDLLRDHFSHHVINWVEQTEQKGTGHALLQALPEIAETDHVLILSGDVPLTPLETLQKLMTKTPEDSIGLLTAHTTHPTGYGRIKRDKHHHIIDIVEEKDATPDELAITEINPGIYFVPATYLKKWLPQLTNHNAQQEYYLTDIIRFAVRDSIHIHTVSPHHVEEVLGINDRMQLNQLERFYQHQQAKQWMQRGVTIMDINRIDIRGDVSIAQDVMLDVNVLLEGNVSIGEGCTIGPNTIIKNTTLSKHVEIQANCVIEGANIADHCIIGPFARIRPGTILSEGVHVGNFVEVKNSQVGQSSKMNHLSYIGDSTIGARVNIGAGTITCNYDGANKHQTIIGDDVHIGSDTQLVAPVTIGEGATIGAGSTVTKDAPAQELTLTHTLKQRSAKWKRPQKKQSIKA